MIEIRKLYEAKDLSNYKIFDPKLKDIFDRNEMVIAWHGTTTFWALWFCLRGVDTTIEPPSKTLGRGSIVSGFTKIKSKGLFVSAFKTAGFRTLVQFEVKPSELGISLEMAELGYKEGQELDTLVAGDCIIVEPLPAKRIINVRHDNENYTRKEFIAKFPDPEEYIQDKYRQQMYDGTSLKRRYEKDQIYKAFKQELESGSLTVIEAIEETERAIRYKDIDVWGITLEDAYEIIEWLKGKL